MTIEHRLPRNANKPPLFLPVQEVVPLCEKPLMTRNYEGDTR